jgi:hypothetical protein
MICKREIEAFLNSNDFTKNYENCFTKLKEPSLFMGAADKLLILHSIRDIKIKINEITHLVSMWDSYNKNEIYHNIDNTTMQLVFKYRKIQEVFNKNEITIEVKYIHYYTSFLFFFFFIFSNTIIKLHLRCET